MKIGILTFHRALNYGAVLQAFALQQVIKSMGHDVEIIDYRQPYHEKIESHFYWDRIWSRNPFKFLWRILQEIILWKPRQQMIDNFTQFANNSLLISSHPCYNINDIPPNYEMYIHGSDQIWSSQLTGGLDVVFLGAYKKKSDAILISYAASMQMKPIPESEKRIFTEHLNKFNYISVREKSLIDILQPLTLHPIHNVVDPTLLSDLTVWDKIIVKPKIEDKYVLIYQVAVNENTLNIAKKIATDIGAKVIQVSAWINASDTNKKYPTPGEFVGYLKYAACVVTTSFHGTTFSLIFNRPFYTILSGAKSDIRFTSLLEQIGLKERIIWDGIAPQFSEIDYSKVDSKLDKYKQSSFSFLEKCSLTVSAK